MIGNDFEVYNLEYESLKPWIYFKMLDGKCDIFIKDVRVNENKMVNGNENESK